MKLIVMVALISGFTGYYLNLPPEPSMNDFVADKLAEYEQERGKYEESIAFSDMTKAEKIEMLWGRK